MLATATARSTSRFAVTRGFASVGDKIPNVELHHQFPPEKINLPEFCADKSVILLGLPGAFTYVFENSIYNMFDTYLFSYVLKASYAPSLL